MNTKRRAIFLDRDGVLNDTVDRGDNFFVEGKKARWGAPSHYRDFKLKTGVPEALERMGKLGFFRVLVTNQPDIFYGLLPREEHDKIMAEIKALPLDDIFICLHSRGEGCECKKPLPGMLLAAAAKHQIDLPSSFIIGDTESDIGAGKVAGCTTILIDYERNRDVNADFRVASLAEAIQIIEQYKK